MGRGTLSPYQCSGPCTVCISLCVAVTLCVTPDPTELCYNLHNAAWHLIARVCRIKVPLSPQPSLQCTLFAESALDTSSPEVHTLCFQFCTCAQCWCLRVYQHRVGTIPLPTTLCKCTHSASTLSLSNVSEDALCVAAMDSVQLL